MNPADRCPPACVLALALLFAAPGCSSEASAAMPPAAGFAPSDSLRGYAVRQSPAQRCRVFAAQFDVFAGCERADGTLRSFPSATIGWRVRYFVRYQRMPCNEAPTEDESYVFHMVVNDLDGDPDLNGMQRTAIRNAMFEGTPRCK